MIVNPETLRILPAHDLPDQGVIAECQQAVDAVTAKVEYHIPRPDHVGEVAKFVPPADATDPIPPAQTLITCAHCRAINRDVNHWFILMPVHTLGEGLGGTVVMGYGWGIFNFREFILKVHQDALPVCGQACALAKLSQFLNGK